MGTRADFYLERDDKRLMWIGSKAHDGSPWNIPTDILIQINPIMFEEMVTDFLLEHRDDSIIRQEGETWPWPWSDSRITDYSYIFIMDKVFAYSPSTKHLFDPLKVVQGEDLDCAKLSYELKFPVMLKQAIKTTEELIDQYGLQPAEAI